MKKKFGICLIILFALFISNTSYSLSSNSNNTTGSSVNYQNLSETIIALDITRKKYLSDLPEQSKLLKKEYSIFIDYLSFQIDHYCTIISKNYGEEVIHELPCSLNNIQEMNMGDYKTSEEKIESLDNDFMAALGEFDEMLLIEDEKIAQISQTDENEGAYNNSQGGSSNGSSNSNETNDDSTQDNEKNKTGNKANKNNSNMNSSSKGRNKKSDNKDYQRKKLDEIDDDIVARQLKEAAEKETNLELKEKLWDEYYKYKKKIAGKK